MEGWRVRPKWTSCSSLRGSMTFGTHMSYNCKKETAWDQDSCHDQSNSPKFVNGGCINTHAFWATIRFRLQLMSNMSHRKSYKFLISSLAWGIRQSPLVLVQHTLLNYNLHDHERLLTSVSKSSFSF